MVAVRAHGVDATGIEWNTQVIQTGKEVLGLEKIFPLCIEEYADQYSGGIFDVVSFF
jgi:hypothetical protein